MLAVSLALAAAPAAAGRFEPVAPEHKALERVPFDSDASAVVLYRRGQLRIMDYPTEVTSSFEVEVRLKVLAEAGKGAGEVEIPHSRFYRLKSIEGRTVLPDGREIALPEEAIFEERRSRSDKYFVTKLVFPGVEVGAILDYRYLMRWDSLFFLEPWYFDSTLPTLLSEITYEIPDRMAVQPWSLRSSRIEMQSELGRAVGDRRLRIWMENLPALPREPYSLSVRALSSRVMLVPMSVNVSGDSIPLLDSWKRTVELFDSLYYRFGSGASGTRKTAAEIARGEPTQRSRVETLFRFVRDQIRTLDRGVDLGIEDGRRADVVLDERQGTEIEKALLLKTMLETLKLKPALVWATRRSEGPADMSVATPWWFDRTMLRVQVEGEQLFLDSSERGSAAGRIAPAFESAQALVLHRKKPEVITLPSSTFEENTRRADLKLVVDGEGRVRGTATMVLRGHHARPHLRWEEDEEAAAKAWSEWIEKRHPGYDVDHVTVEQSVDDQTVRVGWSLAQRDEEVLGDEATLALSRPLGPILQPLVVEPERRLTPTLIEFADRDEVVVELAWAPGWRAEVLPQAHRFDSWAGTLTTRVEHDAAARKLRFSRQVDVRQTLFRGPDEYKAIRDLFEWVEKSDEQRLVLAVR